MRNTTCALATIVLVTSVSAAARAQVPADIAQGLKKIGAIVDPSVREALSASDAEKRRHQQRDAAVPGHRRGARRLIWKST